MPPISARSSARTHGCTGLFSTNPPEFTDLPQRPTRFGWCRSIPNTGTRSRRPCARSRIAATSFPGTARLARSFISSIGINHLLVQHASLRVKYKPIMIVVELGLTHLDYPSKPRSQRRSDRTPHCRWQGRGARSFLAEVHLAAHGECAPPGRPSPGVDLIASEDVRRRRQRRGIRTTAGYAHHVERPALPARFCDGGQRPAPACLMSGAAGLLARELVMDWRCSAPTSPAMTEVGA